MTAEVSLRVLGPLEVWRDGRPVALGAAKQRALLALLLIRGGEVGRDALIDALWGEHPPKGAQNTVQVHLSKLRKALGPNVIEKGPAGYRLASDLGVVDVDRFEELFAAGREALAAGDARDAAQSLAGALALWRGPAFADLRYEAFAQAEAGRLDELRLACTEERIEADLALDKHALVVSELEALVVEQPLRERLRSQLILALYRSGRQAEALAQYQAARRMLADELGLEPSPDLQKLERMILAHDPRLASPGPQQPVARSNLPYLPTPFIGRERELGELVELLHGGSRRLATLTGPGGAGKTRLAIEAANALTDRYPDGVWWVPLQELRDARLVIPAIATAVEARGDLATHLGGARMLLVLDNFEQVLDAGVETAALLTRCPNLALLVTSREPLRVAAEREHRVPPMTESDAVALFNERAAHGAGQAISLGDEQTVVEICGRLDYLPLALELAAARLKLFTPKQLLSRLNQRLALLRRGPRDAPKRQQALRATLEWSYDLLDQDEQRLFRSLAVFAGGCSYEAAEEICGADPDTLESLLDKSLVQRRDTDAGPRYWLLETVREYARELTESSGEDDVLHRRHADWFIAQSAQARDALFGGEILTQSSPQAWLRVEHPNFRVAFEWAFARDEARTVQQLAAYSGLAWVFSGAWDEGRALLERVLEQTGAIPADDHASICFNLTFVAYLQDVGEGVDPSDAEAFCERSLERFEQAGDPRGVRDAAILLVQLATERGDMAEARSRLEQMRAAYPPVSDYDRARLCLAEAFLEAGAGRFSQAQRLMEETLALLARSGRPRLWDRDHLLSLAHWAICAGDLARAKSAMHEHLSYGSDGEVASVAFAHDKLAYIALREGNRDEAARHIRELVECARRWPAWKGTSVDVLFGSACLAALDGNKERAVRLWGATEAIDPEIGQGLARARRWIIDQYIKPARAAFAPDSCARVEAEGAAMTVEEAIVYALEGLTQPTTTEKPATAIVLAIQPIARRTTG